MTRNTLVVGGSGMIGSHIAADLIRAGDRVTIASRREASDQDPPGISECARLALDYTDPELKPNALSGFDAIVFAAGNDIRHVKAEDENDEFWRTVQSEGVPRFAALAKAAGVERFVQIGSYYHQLNPAWAEGNPYIAARLAADEGARSLAGDGFIPVTLNPPSIVGTIPGRNLRGFRRMISWVRGELEAPELFGPKGGTNYMSVESLSQAVLHSLEVGEAGRAYLVGDENLSYTEYFQKLADAADSNRVIEERDEEQAYLPDRFIVQGRGNVISFEPDPALTYARGDIDRALAEIVRQADALK